jgi:chemotaxis protein methyltransferase CheR
MESSHSNRVLSDLLEKHTGQVVAANRQWRLEMTLKPVMRRYSIPDIETLAAVINSGAEEQLKIDCVEAMINNETCFFRDQANFALLTGPLLDSLRAQNGVSKTLRIWSAACSTGQEPYSLAMMICENAEKWQGWAIEIFATDVSASALKRASEGRYSQFEIQRGMPVVLMLKYFTQVGEDWVINENLRKMVTFRQHNMLAKVENHRKFDVILCRNMLMYLCDDKRRQVLDTISTSVSSSGLVMLGAAETVIGQTEKLNASREFRGFYQTTEFASRRQGHLISDLAQPPNIAALAT